MMQEGGLSSVNKMKKEKTGDDETCHFERLPLELLPKIFDHLENADVENCFNTCTTWNDILEEKKNMFQFELVLPILLKKLSLEDCLKCRLVCGKWKQFTDEILENHPSRVNLLYGLGNTNDPTLISGRLFGKFGMVIDRDSNMLTHPHKEFLAEMGSHQSNPFVGRSLRMRANNPGEYWNRARNILERFGDQLWYADICFGFVDFPNGEPRRAVEESVKDTLILLPNLKWLYLDVFVPINQRIAGILDARALEYFRQNSLPKLQNLETFGTKYSDVPAVLITSVVNSLDKYVLKRLFIPATKYKDISSNFPNLEELAIQIDVHGLAKLHQESPHLKKLWLLIDGSEQSKDGISESISKLFKVLELFKDTLTELSIRSDTRTFLDFETEADFRINLPNLEKLGLEIRFGMFFETKTLKNLGTLKHFEIWEFYGAEQTKSYQLKIGRHVPSLETFVYDALIRRVEMKRDLFSKDKSLVIQKVEERPHYAELYAQRRHDGIRTKIIVTGVMVLFLILFGIILFGVGYLFVRYGVWSAIGQTFEEFKSLKVEEQIANGVFLIFCLVLEYHLYRWMIGRWSRIFHLPS